MDADADAEKAALCVAAARPTRNLPGARGATAKGDQLNVLIIARELDTIPHTQQAARWTNRAAEGLWRHGRFTIVLVSGIVT